MKKMTSHDLPNELCDDVENYFSPVLTFFYDIIYNIHPAPFPLQASICTYVQRVHTVYWYLNIRD